MSLTVVGTPPHIDIYWSKAAPSLTNSKTVPRSTDDDPAANTRVIVIA